MKNILKLIILIMTFFAMSNNVFAKTNYIKLGNQIPNIRLHLKTPSVEKNKNMYEIINQNTNELVYCIEPGVMLYDGNFTEYSDISNVDIDLTEEEWKYISVIAFYGYNYKDRTDIKWYVATQVMIWDYLLRDSGEIYFIDNDNNKINLYKDEIKAIQKDIDTLNELPSFAVSKYDYKNPQYTLKINEEITIEDTNNFLDNFIVSSGDVDVTPHVDGNKITVKFIHPGPNLLYFNKEYNAKGTPKIYYNTGSQAVMSRGNVQMPSGLTYFNVLNPSLKLIKTSSEESSLSLENAKYGIYYESGDLYDTITTDKEGVAYLNEIWGGKYYLQEIEAPYGYLVNDKKIYFEVTDKDIVLEVKNNLIKKTVNIEKYMEDVKGKLISEASSKFEVYDNSTNKLIKTITTNKYGKVSINLPYGKYILKQIKGSVGYNFSDDITLEVNEKYNESKSLIIINKEITGNLKLIKKDSDTKEIIKDTASFKILNIDTNTYFKVGNKSNFKTVDGVLELTNIPYGKYKVIETDAPVGYELLKEEITFEIKENDKTIELSIENQKSKGTLTINKFDKDTKDPISEVLFGIYNEDKELMFERSTNELGVIEINDLVYGTYYVKELKNADNYKLNDYEYKVVISKDNTTLNIENEKLKGNLTIRKIDKDTKEPIGGVLFGIYNEDKELMFERSTNELGIIEINDLVYGTYYIKELKTLNNYKQNSNEYEVIISKDNVELDIENEKLKGSIEIKKIDSLTKDVISDVKFGLYNEKNELIKEAYTNELGIIEFSDLEIGTYYIKELLASDKYELNDEEIKVEVKDNIRSMVTVANRMKIKVPKTGVEEFLITILTSVFILLVGMFICNYEKEK